ncbi:cation diffusion facilitator family transporter [Haloferula sargassicola]|uniref:Metal cation efflux system protein CzcD n=1 Tax=Haloferula sargassicola TaxID=490096 RepID=A0ABP9UIA1_9BACT
MGHNHHHDHGSEGNLKVAFFLNAAFTVVEIFGGLWTNSIAILADALHDAGDTASLGLAWYFERMSRRGRTSRHTYGYRRFRLLGGLITGLVLLAGLVTVLWQAVDRLRSPETVNAPGMIGLAVLGIVVNGAAVLRVKRGSSLTEQVVSWHLLEDTLGWVAVLIGAGVMAIWDLPIIDPLLSIGISLFILWNVGRNLWRVMAVFLQTTPDSFDPDRFETDLRERAKVEDVHHLHVWSLDGEKHVLTFHVVMAGDATRGEIVALKTWVRDHLDDEDFPHVTVDVELAGECCVSADGVMHPSPEHGA